MDCFALLAMTKLFWYHINCKIVQDPKINAGSFIMQHPYLYFSKHDINAFCERLKTDKELKKRYDSLTAEKENCLGEEFITEEQANGRNTQSQHADFGSLNHQANRMCDVLGTAYLVEGDEKCAEKLKNLLLHFITFERWYSVSYTKRTPVPWHSDLCSTSTTLALARIYDIIFDYLTEEERRKISDGILEKGVYAALGDWVFHETRIHAVDSMGHNWWSVCISEAAAAFLAVSDFVEKRRKKEVLQSIDAALADYLTYPGNTLFNKLRNFDDKGFFYESINYNNFGTGSLLRYLMCSERYFGRNETIRNALPENLCDGAMMFSYPCTKDGKLFYEFLNFGDHSTGTTLDFLAKMSVINGIDSSAMRACASTYKNDINDEISGKYFPEKLSGSVDYLPKSVLYSSGYAVTRSSWEADATLLAVKSGFCWNHSHNDSGSFVIYHKGKQLFTDSGRCDYDSPLYHAYYCQDSAHSVVRIGGKGRRDEELYRGTKFPGKLTDSYESDSLFFVQADSTGPMAHLCSRLYRNFIWLDSRILVIFDDIYCHEENTAQFTLHFDAEYKASENSVDFDNGISRARLISHKPQGMIITEKAGHHDHMPETDIPYIELSTENAQRTHLLIHTLELDNDNYSTEYTELSGENSSGIRISENGKETEIWFNHMADGHIMHDNSNNVIAGYETDAYMLVIRKDKIRGNKKVLMICGSYLRTGSKTYIGSFIKKTQEVITEY